ncbi:type II toxin-antitoxin system death-on-curing family toxin [Desulfitispora alkaliphila]|uniref:type II toxin-antitoxin system death-on-curing family toxin n=1 Tax=Desulfitispora alkaliphila TaxID=622674 RepID=UPI003D1C18AD
MNNHGFVDGNKRVGVAVMLLLLKLNDIRVKNTQSELVQLGLDIASGVTNEKEILEWIKKHKDYINNDNKEKR